MPSLRHALAALSIFAALAGAAQAQERIKVVATFSILADLARNVGGERVEVTALVGPNADAHVYAPPPQDAKKLAEAKVVVSNGLGFEGWMTRLIKASGTKATLVAASKGIDARKTSDTQGHSHGNSNVDPHAWQSIGNAKIYIQNVRNALIDADPDGKATYEANAESYLAKLDALEREAKETIAGIPPDRRRIITTHDAFGYFGAAYGLEFVAPQGVSTEADISAKDVAKIIAQVKRQKIPAVFLENVSDARLLNRVADETGAKIGGTLYSDALTHDKGEAPTYIDLIRHNLRVLSLALTS